MLCHSSRMVCNSCVIFCSRAERGAEGVLVEGETSHAVGTRESMRWRRERDSNPREAVSPYTISSRARSSTPAPLRVGGRVIIPMLPSGVHRTATLGRVAVQAIWRVKPGQTHRSAPTGALNHLKRNAIGQAGLLTRYTWLPYDGLTSGNAGG